MKTKHQHERFTSTCDICMKPMCFGCASVDNADVWVHTKCVRTANRQLKTGELNKETK